MLTLRLEDRLALLVATDILQIHVEQVGGIHWTTFRLGMELSAEDGSGLMYQPLVRMIIDLIGSLAIPWSVLVFTESYDLRSILSTLVVGYCCPPRTHGSAT